MTTRLALTGLILLFLGRPEFARAQDHEGYALRQATAHWDKIISELAASPNNADTQSFASELYFEFIDRRDNLKDLRFRGMGHNPAVIDYIEATGLPEIERIFKGWGTSPESRFYEEAKVRDRQLIDVTEARLQKLWSEMTQQSSGIKRVMQFLAFSRSETIGDGTIGDWNPNNPTNIQSTAITGLLQVMERVEQKGDKSLDLDEIKDFHRTLIGAAEHHFSRGGSINDIVFQQQDGQRRHVNEYLREWEAEIKRQRPGLIAGFEAYIRFLHLHPFGDVNGRIAEVIKQDVNGRAGLPPTITREKISCENYLFQNIFGRGNYYREINNMALETESFLNTWAEILGRNGQILDVYLAGPHVVTTVLRDGIKFAVLNNRTYTVPDGVELPPVKNAPVLVGRGVSDLNLRYTFDNWQTQQEITPAAAVSKERIGQVGLHLPFYVLKGAGNIPDSGIKTDFAFNYQQQNGSVVWFKNRDSNFNAIIGRPQLTTCGILTSRFN